MMSLIKICKFSLIKAFISLSLFTGICLIRRINKRKSFILERSLNLLINICGSCGKPSTGNTPVEEQTHRYIYWKHTGIPVCLLFYRCVLTRSCLSSYLLQYNALSQIKLFEKVSNSPISISSNVS